jgi:general secretion pathway protein H
MSSGDPEACSTSGFTLIEMLAVMMIIALVASLVVMFVPGTGRSGLKAIVMDSAALLRRERMSAMLMRRDRHVALDGESRVLIGDSGTQVLIPRDVTLDILGADAVWDGRLAVAAFHPDGASSGATLRFSREGAAYEIRVNWYTGGVAVEAD